MATTTKPASTSTKGKASKPAPAPVQPATPTVRNAAIAKGGANLPTPFGATVLRHIATGTNTRRALIVATGRGTGWAKLLGAHTLGAATGVAGNGQQGPGMLGAGWLAYSPAGKVYTVTPAGMAVLHASVAAGLCPALPTSAPTKPTKGRKGK